MSFFNDSVRMIAYSINDAGKPMTRAEIFANCSDIGHAIGRERMNLALNQLTEIGALICSRSMPGSHIVHELAPNWLELCEKLSLPVVYLAGKMNGGSVDEQTQGINQDWRWPLIGEELIRPNEDFWPNVAMGQFHYAGPFYGNWKSHMPLQGKDLHGVGADRDWGVGGRDQSQVIKFCIDAIHSSDIVFAWMDTNDAHGTLMEIAWACAKYANVTLVVPPCDCSIESSNDNHTCLYGEVWFAQAMVRRCGGTVIYSNDPVEEFHKVVARWNRTNQKFNSVPEKEFWTRAINDSAKGLLYRDIVPQHPVGKYRIDFAIPELKFGIEIDGLAYHNGQDSFMKDRSRQREIESQGWRIVRFAAKEVSLDVDKCFREAEAIALELSQSLVGAK